MKLYMFRTVCLSIIRSLFTVHSAMVYVIQVCRQLSSGTRMELGCCSSREFPFFWGGEGGIREFISMVTGVLRRTEFAAG